MKFKWIKMPDGRLVKHSLDKLELLISQKEPFILAQSISLNNNIIKEQPENHNQQIYNTKDFKVQKLAGHQVTIFGAGAVGSYIGYFLSPANLGLSIVDFKDVQLKHVSGGRTIYEHDMVGLKKVYAAKKKIERDYPCTKVHTFPYNISEIPDTELQYMFGSSVIVIIAIDDPKQILRISDLAFPVVELIQVAMHTGAKSGHIAISIPFVTPCLRCTLDISDHTEIIHLDSEPANSWDIMTVAQLAARIAVDIMYSRIVGQVISRWDISKNLIYVANTRQQLSPDGPGIHFEGSWKRPGCPVCNA